MEINLNNIKVTINDDLAKKYQSLMGDETEFLGTVFTSMIETETKMSLSDAISHYSAQHLQDIITTRILAELKMFGG